MIPAKTLRERMTKALTDAAIDRGLLANNRPLFGEDIEFLVDAALEVIGDPSLMPTGKDEEQRALEEHEADLIRGRMENLLHGVANALKGEPKPLHMHSWHDLPEVAANMKREVFAWRLLARRQARGDRD